MEFLGRRLPPRRSRHSPSAKGDIQHYGTTQAPERDDVLNIGGFSDAVFQVVASYIHPG